MKRSHTQSRIDRRRKIVEKSSDRLDLIRGQYRTLSFNNIQSPTYISTPFAHPSSSQSPFDFYRDRRYDGEEGYRGEAEDETPRSTFSRDDPISRDNPTRKDTFQANTTTSKTPNVNDTSNAEPRSAREPSTDHTNTPRGSKHFSKQLSSFIKASAKTRAFCAVMTSILAVMSYTNASIFGRNIARPETRIVLASRSVCIVMLADVAIVLAGLIFKMQRTRGENGDESGSLAFRIIRALFIDCSIYLLVLVCGLSLV